MSEARRRASDSGDRGLLRRFRWRGRGATLDVRTDQAIVARVLAYLFGGGGILLLITLALPGAPGRETSGLAIVAVLAILVAALLISAYDSMPVSLLQAAPFAGTLLVGGAIVYGGDQSTASYAMYLTWAIAAAALFLELRLILVHGVAAVAVFAVALEVGETSTPIGLQLAMAGGTVLALAVVMSGIARQVRHGLSQLELAAQTDPLTGVLNRRALEEAFDRELARASREGSELGFVILDVDGFMQYNDRNGHPAGDLALQRLGKVMDDSTRAVDYVARMGGEEFAVLAPGSGLAGALAMAERLRRAIEIEFSIADDDLTVSCGVAGYPTNGEDSHALVAAADSALYEAKRQGRNRALASAGSA